MVAAGYRWRSRSTAPGYGCLETKGGLEPYRKKLIDGMLARGYEPDFSNKLFSQIKGFGDYGFQSPIQPALPSLPMSHLA